MKNSNLRGVGTVFRYTVQQHYKTRSVIIFLIILFAAAVASLPLAASIAGGDREVSETGIRKLYVRNETGFALDTDALLADARYEAIQIEETGEDDAALNQRLTKEKSAAVTVISLEAEAYHFSVVTRYGKDSDVKHLDAATLNHVLEDVLHQSLLKSLSVTEAQEAMIHAQTVSQVSKVSDFLRGAEESNADTHVFASLIYNYLIMILSALSMAYIFQHCTEEKASKLVEVLMVSVSPTALLAGKILAVTVFVFGGLVLVGAGFAISALITGHFWDLAVVRDLLLKLLKFDPTGLKLSAGTVVLFIVCLLLVYAIYASLSGIVGSCCSKAEDTQHASLVVLMFMMIGYMAGVFAPMFESEAANVFVSLFPVTSPFSAFPNFVCGKIGLPVLLLSLAIQAVTAFFLLRLAGAVYRMMLLYRGGFPKPKQFLQMLKEQRASHSAQAGKEGSHAE